MALQKRRRGPARTGHQRSAWMKKSGENMPLTQACPNCAAPRLPHRVCMACGFYDGTQIVKGKSAAAE
jgi:large subunit ribosomal protein L32